MLVYHNWWNNLKEPSSFQSIPPYVIGDACILQYPELKNQQHQQIKPL